MKGDIFSRHTDLIWANEGYSYNYSHKAIYWVLTSGTTAVLTETRTDQGCDDVKLGREPIDDESRRGFDLARRIKTLPETVS